jgi:hypothetical protein
MTRYAGLGAQRGYLYGRFEVDAWPLGQLAEQMPFEDRGCAERVRQAHEAGREAVLALRWGLTDALRWAAWRAEHGVELHVLVHGADRTTDCAWFDDTRSDDYAGRCVELYTAERTGRTRGGRFAVVAALVQREAFAPFDAETALWWLGEDMRTGEPPEGGARLFGDAPAAAPRAPAALRRALRLPEEP